MKTFPRSVKGMYKVVDTANERHGMLYARVINVVVFTSIKIVLRLVDPNKLQSDV